MFMALDKMPAAGTVRLLAQFLPLVVLIVVFYFVLIRPQRKRDKQEREMRNSISVGDEISTIGGFIGRVVSIKGRHAGHRKSSDRNLQAQDLPLGDRGKEAPATETVEAPKGSCADAAVLKRMRYIRECSGYPYSAEWLGHMRKNQ